MKRTIGNWKKYDAAIGAKGPVLKLNCTTRAITYALKANYDEVFARQHDIAEKCDNPLYNVHYNSNTTTDKILRDAGYQCVVVDCCRAGDFAKLAEKSKYPIVVYTSKHLTVCDKGEVVDTWDSTTRWVQQAWVKGEDLELVKNMPARCSRWGKEISEFEKFMRSFKKSMAKRLNASEEKLNEMVEQILAA